jgi:alkanesulfonate monooxygenase SsuD/methylene tetrahydromethanopterin reductase-like flavin-dependent oxidoreductase (luciferase family)
VAGHPDDSSACQVGIYLPQLGLTYDELLARARRCEDLGYRSLWLFDHLYPPGLPDVPSFEAWTLATALLVQTSRLRVGHLVLCNGFRHPALLAKMATSLDVVSGGRLELGIGSGSYQPEHGQAGMTWSSLGERTERLAESLEILTRAFAGDRVSFAGRHYQVEDLPMRPRPAQSPRPPITVGGVSERFTLPVVARYADVWNVPTYALGDLDRRIAALGAACEKVRRDAAEIALSLEAVVALAPDDRALPEVRALAERRFGAPGFGLAEGGLVGTPDRVLDRLRALQELGFTRFALFTHDRAADASLGLLAEQVLSRL